VPFFAWLFEQPELVDGRFHTTYLDDVLKARGGRPFVEPPTEVEDVAAIAMALQALLPAWPATSAVEDRPPESVRRWKTQSRLDALRGDGRALPRRPRR
jgi:hypothetical protein